MSSDELELLYRREYKHMYRIACAFLNNQDLSLDAVQETFRIACEKSSELASSSSVEAWLVKTLRNVIGNIYKQRKKLLWLIEPLCETSGVTEMELSVRTEYYGTLDSKSLELLIWIYCEGISYCEAATRLGISLNACKKRIQRAKEQLRKIL